MLSRRDYLRLVGKLVAAGAAGKASGALANSSSYDTSSAASAYSQADQASFATADAADGWTGGWPLWLSRAGEQYLFDARTPQGYDVARYLLRDVRAGVSGNPIPGC